MLRDGASPLIAFHFLLHGVAMWSLEIDSIDSAMIFLVCPNSLGKGGLEQKAR